MNRGQTLLDTPADWRALLHSKLVDATQWYAETVALGGEPQDDPTGGTQMLHRMARVPDGGDPAVELVAADGEPWVVRPDADRRAVRLNLAVLGLDLSEQPDRDALADVAVAVLLQMRARPEALEPELTGQAVVAPADL